MNGECVILHLPLSVFILHPSAFILPPVSRQGPRRAGRVGHGGTKLPVVVAQLAENPLDQRRFAAEQMDDVRNIQQYALGENVRIDSHEGRELLAPRRHGLESVDRLRSEISNSQAEDAFHAISTSPKAGCCRMALIRRRGRGMPVHGVRQRYSVKYPDSG
jgi:hypothetical protein